MFIVDLQVHIWADLKAPTSSVNGLGWRTASHQIERPSRKADRAMKNCRGLMDEAGVNRALIVPPSWEGDRVDRRGLEAAHKYPDRFAVMARIPLEKPTEAKALLKSWEKEPAIKGTRLTFHRDEDRPWLTDGTADWYWPFAEERGIPTMVHAPERKPQLEAIAGRHPKLRIILDHMGILGHSVDDKIAPWIDSTVAMAKYPNVYVKVSSVPGYSTEALSLSRPQQICREDRQSLWPGTVFLGNRPHPHARKMQAQLPSDGQPFHEAHELPQRKR